MRRAGFSLVVRALFLAAALLARASADDVVADTPEATPPATPSPEAQEQAVAQINEALAPYQPEAGLTPEQIVECQHRLAAAVDSINQGQQVSGGMGPGPSLLYEGGGCRWSGACWCGREAQLVLVPASRDH